MTRVQAPEPQLTTSDRFGLILPERRDNVLIDVLRAAFLRLDADAANLRLPSNVFEGTVEATGLKLTNPTPQAGQPQYVLGMGAAGAGVGVWVRTAVGQEATHTWTWNGSQLRPTDNHPVGVASLAATAAISAASMTASGHVSSATLATTGNATIGGTLGVTGNTNVSTLSATGNITMGTADQGGRPQRVIGANADGVMRWWPANAIGPPQAARIFQGAISGTLPYNNFNPASVISNIAPWGDGIGVTLSGGTATLTRSGFLYVYAMGESSGNQWAHATNGQAQWKLQVRHNGVGQPNRAESFTVCRAEGGVTRTHCAWFDLVSAGQTIEIEAYIQGHGYEQAYGGFVEFVFVPTADYPN